MPCYYPIAAFELPNGSVRVGFDNGRGRPMRLPCGKCVGCKLERSRQWAVRCMHEASLHEENCFITLTYDEEHLPLGGSLVVKDFQDFMKRLRARIAPRKVRYYHAGEYGTKYGRPHYHALLFGYAFGDKVLVSERAGFRVYRSRLLESVWEAGRSEVGSVTFESAAYVAGYVVAKDDRCVLGVNADGECCELQPEYSTMSRRPGIGALWFERFGREVYPADGVVVNGVLRKPPRYYDVAAKLAFPGEFEEAREARRRAFRADLAAAKANCEARLSFKRRELE